MSDQLSPAEFQRRSAKLQQVLRSAMHDITDDQEWGCDPDEHERRHVLYAAAMLTGMIYALDYPEQARRFHTYVTPVGNLTPSPVDVLAGRVEKLVPKPKLNGDDLVEHVVGLLSKEPNGGSIEPVVPVFDEDGELKWELVEGKTVFPTWEESEFMQWPEDG